MRMLGEYLIVPTSAPVATDQARVSVGIAVFAEDAVAAGAFPDPDDEPEFPWMYWASHPFHFSSTSTDPSSAGAALRHTFDIRSMRKVKPQQSLAFAVQYVNVTGNPPLTICTGGIRLLIAE